MQGLLQKVTAGVVNVIYSRYTEGPGAAFGLLEDGTKVFISPRNYREGYVPEVGDTVELIIVPNHPDHRDKTDFKAVSCKFICSLEASTPENIVQVNKEPTLEEKIMDVLDGWCDDNGDWIPMTTRQICDELGSGYGVAADIRDELSRLHKSGKIVKADIKSTENQKRVSLTLWAYTLHAFTYGMEENEIDEAVEVHSQTAVNI